MPDPADDDMDTRNNVAAYVRSTGADDELAQTIAHNVVANPNSDVARGYLTSAAHWRQSRDAINSFANFAAEPAQDRAAAAGGDEAARERGEIRSGSAPQSVIDSYHYHYGATPVDQANDSAAAHAEQSKVMAQRAEYRRNAALYAPVNGNPQADMIRRQQQAMFSGACGPAAAIQQWAGKSAQMLSAIPKPVTPHPIAVPVIQAFGQQKVAQLQQQLGMPPDVAAQVVANLYSPHLQAINEMNTPDAEYDAAVKQTVDRLGPGDALGGNKQPSLWDDVKGGAAMAAGSVKDAL